MKEQAKIFCTGTAVGSNNRRLIGFRIVSDDGELAGKTMYFHSKHYRACRVGQIYQVSMTTDGSSVTFHSDPEYLMLHPDSEVILKYRIESETAETCISARNQAKKDAKEKSDIMDLLKPLRKQWQRTTGEGQIALELRVLHYLRNGRDL